MPLNTGQVSRLDIPGEPGQWMEFKHLGVADLKACQAEARRQGSTQLREFGPDIFERISNRPSTGKVADPLNTHDELTLLERGVAGWSYHVALPPFGDHDAARRARLAILGELRPDTSEWAARSVMEFAGVDNARGEANDMLDVTARQSDRPRLTGIMGRIQDEAEDALAEDPTTPSWRSSTG